MAQQPHSDTGSETTLTTQDARQGARGKHVLTVLLTALGLLAIAMVALLWWGIGTAPPVSQQVNPGSLPQAESPPPPTTGPPARGMPAPVSPMPDPQAVPPR
jgi:hypothetical protein